MSEMIDSMIRYNLPRWIMDGWTQGNMNWEEADEFTQEAAQYAADAVLEGMMRHLEDSGSLTEKIVVAPIVRTRRRPLAPARDRG